MNLIERLYYSGLLLDRKLRRSHKLAAPVISIGNISSGGRAKTPFVIFLANELKARGLKPIVLSRGYGRNTKHSTWISELRADEFDWQHLGDEPIEIFLKTEVPVLVGKNRVSNARKYVNQFKNKKGFVFILDDGFQHWAIQRDFDIVIIKSFDKKDKLLPFGRLREPVSSLERANLVLELGSDFKKVTVMPNLESNELKYYSLTTRAQTSEYNSYIDSQLKNVEHISFSDHDLFNKMEAFIQTHKGEHYLLGFKEAVKLFGLDDINLLIKNKKVSVTVNGVLKNFYLVDCEIDFIDKGYFFKRMEDLCLQKLHLK